MLTIYRHRNQREKATKILEEILENNPQNYKIALELAVQLRDTEMPHQAADLLTRLGRKIDEDRSILTAVFENYLERKDYKTAVWVLEGMLKGAPQSSELHYLAGVAYDGLEKEQQALDHLKHVSVGSSFFNSAVVHRALLYHDMGKIDRAIDVIKEALATSPPQADYYLYLGSFYEELERYNEAVEVLLQGLAMDSENSKLHFRLGVVYDKMGRRKESIDAMKTVVRLKPNNADALNYLGYTYADMGINLDEAESLIQNALKIKPEDGYITDSLGWVYYKRGQYRQALEYLMKAVELVPDDPVILEHIGDVHRKMNNTIEALNYYRRSIEKSSKNKVAIEKKIKSLK